MLPFYWNLTTPFDITTLSSPRFINLWDYDFGTTDEFMGYVGFLMTDYTTSTNPYPLTVNKTQNGITITLNLTWY